MFKIIYKINTTSDAAISNLYAFAPLFFLIRFSEYAFAAIVVKIKNKVIPWSRSTRVNELDSGKAESIIYLLPMTANKAPTVNPKRESIPSA